MPSSVHSAHARPFNLSRWFALVAMLLIGVIAIAIGFLLDRFVSQRLLWQEAVLTKQFVASLVQAEQPLRKYFAGAPGVLDPDVEVAFKRLAALPDMLRANVYDTDRRMIWSSDKQLIGRTFGPNEELDEALAGDVVTQSASLHSSHRDKDEHQDLSHPQGIYVELYVPVPNPQGGKPQAVIEFYKHPRAMLAALGNLRMYIALGALASGALLFVSLFGLVRRADLTIRRQQRHLVDNETLAVIGEMSAAVAHGIRNPLASIRSSAELIQGGDLPQAHEAAEDIVAQSDRLEVWVRELLAYTRPLDQAIAQVQLQPLVTRCMAEVERDMQRRQIGSLTELAAELPPVRGDTLLLGQVLGSLLANAIEAIDREGQVIVRGEWQRGQGEVMLSVQDNGPGMTRTQLGRAGKPFHTTKTRGLGVGLALARRVVERFGGRLEIQSEAGAGTTVRLHLQVA